MTLRLKKIEIQFGIHDVAYLMWQSVFGWLPQLWYLPEQKRNSHGQFRPLPKIRRIVLPITHQAAVTLGLLLIGLAGSIYFGYSVVKADLPKPDITTASVPPAPIATIEAKPLGLPRSVPTRLRIPTINVDTSFIELGRNDDGTMQVPEAYEVVGWYKFAPTPGEIGPAIVVGHIDNYRGPAVFWKLGQLQPGDVVEIDRADGTTVKFKIEAIKQFSQDQFPTAEVYGNIDHAGLRLITCGGQFNRLTRQYSDNTVVFATVVQ
ncbi:class F sortase [Candidatus Microgenomates bacterium]|nr:class F sortase [Candidatus Microgenomates bacterium]